MKIATNLLAPATITPFADPRAEPVEPATGQIPLPFPGMTPVLPAPVERGDARVIRERDRGGALRRLRPGDPGDDHHRRPGR